VGPAWKVVLRRFCSGATAGTGGGSGTPGSSTRCSFCQTVSQRYRSSPSYVLRRAVALIFSGRRLFVFFGSLSDRDWAQEDHDRGATWLAALLYVPIYHAMIILFQFR